MRIYIRSVPPFHARCTRLKCSQSSHDLDNNNTVLVTSTKPSNPANKPSIVVVFSIYSANINVRCIFCSRRVVLWPRIICFHSFIYIRRNCPACGHVRMTDQWMFELYVYDTEGHLEDILELRVATTISRFHTMYGNKPWRTITDPCIRLRCPTSSRMLHTR